MSDSASSKPTPAPSILVVDDDAMLLRMTQLVLADCEYRVSTAASGLDALRVLSDVAGDFDLVILDMRMPDMDGMEVLERVHAKWPGLKVMLVTGYAADGILQANHHKGVVAVLEKPYDPETLVAAVRAIVGN